VPAATYFTTMVSALLQPSAQELDVYQDAARLLERERRSQLTVAGRKFRIIRVETSLAPSPSRPAGWEWLRSRWWGSPLVWTRHSKTAVLAVLGYQIVSYGLPLLPRALACLRLQVSPTGGEEPKAPEERGMAPVNR
jgi:hypothetical protein